MLPSTIIAALATYATFIEPQKLDIVALEISPRHLPPEFNGYKIVQISDFHMGRGGAMNLHCMALIAAHVAQLQPDLIVITGDIAHYLYTADDLAEISAALEMFSAPDGIYAVSGNHDHRGDALALFETIQTSGVRLLINQSETIQRGAAALYLAGMDDLHEGAPNLEATLDGIPPDVCTILLFHEPDVAAPIARDGRIALMLSGHTHGGQVRLPFFGSPLLPLIGAKYDQGLFFVHDMLLYVNRGLGCGIPALRFNCLPEITCFTLRAG